MKLRAFLTANIVLVGGVSLFLFGAQAQQENSLKEGMKDMPTLHPVRTFVVSGKEDWAALTGFGTKAEEVRMMNLMMIGGSGMEGMRMAMGKMETPSVSNTPMQSGYTVRASIEPNPPKVGENQLALSLFDSDGKPLTGLKLQATVEMRNMDMGVAHPTITEDSPGHYVLKPTFSMLGPWRVLITSQGAPMASAPMGPLRYEMDFDVGSKTPWQQPQPWHLEWVNLPEKPQVGKNTLSFRVIDPQGNPVKGATVQATVAMTSMNMGTAHPKVVEKDGVYSLDAEFTMLGPWRVTLRVTPPRAKPFVQTLDVEVKAD